MPRCVPPRHPWCMWWTENSPLLLPGPAWQLAAEDTQQSPPSAPARLGAGKASGVSDAPSSCRIPEAASGWPSQTGSALRTLRPLCPCIHRSPCGRAVHTKAASFAWGVCVSALLAVPLCLYPRARHLCLRASHLNTRRSLMSANETTLAPHPHPHHSPPVHQPPALKGAVGHRVHMPPAPSQMTGPVPARMRHCVVHVVHRLCRSWRGVQCMCLWRSLVLRRLL